MQSSTTSDPTYARLLAVIERQEQIIAHQEEKLERYEARLAEQEAKIKEQEARIAEFTIAGDSSPYTTAASFISLRIATAIDSRREASRSDHRNRLLLWQIIS